MKIRIIKILSLIFLLGITRVDPTNSYFLDREVSTGNVVIAGCWSPPSAPTLIYPANGYVASASSDWLANPYMDWGDSWVCPDKTVSYQYESYRDSALTNLAYRSNPLLVNSTIPAPGTPDGDYYWRVRAYDGEKWSEWSETWLLTVDRTSPPVTPTQTVIINEVMWMGTTASTADEWIELKNTTGNPVDLSDWKIENAGDGTPNLTIPSGKIIPANGYFLIANYPKTNSALNVDVDWDTTTMGLANDGEKLILKDSGGNTVDETPSGSWPAGINSTTRNSMERNNDPSTGWHSCEDSACNDTTYWDSEGNDYGTPKAANLSDNDISVIATNLDFYSRFDKKAVGFRLYGNQLALFTSFEYSIVYDPNGLTQGIKGGGNIEGKNEIKIDDLLLGICSSGGTCVYHQGVTKVNLEINLFGPIERKLVQEINL